MYALAAGLIMCVYGHCFEQPADHAVQWMRNSYTLNHALPADKGSWVFYGWAEDRMGDDYRTQDRFGKAYASHDFPELTVGDEIDVRADFYIPADPHGNVLTILDIECRQQYCEDPDASGAYGYGTRVWMKNGYLVYDRSKLKNPTISDNNIVLDQWPVPIGEWFRLRFRKNLGTDNSGRTRIYVTHAGTNGGEELRLMSEYGPNLPRVGDDDGGVWGSYVSYIHHGVTVAGSGARSISLITDNLDLIANGNPEDPNFRSQWDFENGEVVPPYARISTFGNRVSFGETRKLR